MYQGTSLVVHLLRFCTSTAGGMGLIPGQGTKIPHATQHGKKLNKLKISEQKNPKKVYLDIECISNVDFNKETGLSLLFSEYTVIFDWVMLDPAY